MKYLNTTFIILLSLFFFSCSNKDSKNESTVETSEDTVSMAPPELFSSYLVNDILGEDDEDLQNYLETDIYPLLSKSSKVTMDKISSSLYIIEYEENGTDKAYIIQKCYSPLKQEIVYVRKETTLNAPKQYLK